MNLDRELLFRFFNKETTLEEEKKIRLWIDECDEHRCEFFRERQLFDAILLHGDPSYEKSRPRFYIPWHKVVATLSGIAAIVILTIITTTYFLQQSFRDEVMNTVTVPQGQRVHLTLSDGTKVWLNAKTKMEYPQSFKVSDQRIVKVDGEAYFEVAKDKKPFIVKTSRYDVEVLGTTFSVEAYKDKPNFRTMLYAGKVKLYNTKTPKAVYLSPGQTAELQGESLRVVPTTDPNSYRWKDGLIYIEDKSFHAIMELFEKFYDVQIVVNNKAVEDLGYRGKLRVSDGVDHALRVLQNDFPFKYKRDEEKNIIYIN